MRVRELAKKIQDIGVDNYELHNEKLIKAQDKLWNITRSNLEVIGKLMK